MSAWDSYPAHYQAEIVQAIVGASQAGECSALIGLSGSGKSNLMGFLAHRQRAPALDFPAGSSRAGLRKG